MLAEGSGSSFRLNSRPHICKIHVMPFSPQALSNLYFCFVVKTSYVLFPYPFFLFLDKLIVVHSFQTIYLYILIVCFVYSFKNNIILFLFMCAHLSLRNYNDGNIRLFPTHIMGHSRQSSGDRAVSDDHIQGPIMQSMYSGFCPWPFQISFIPMVSLFYSLKPKSHATAFIHAIFSYTIFLWNILQTHRGQITLADKHYFRVLKEME